MHESDSENNNRSQPVGKQVVTLVRLCNRQGEMLLFALAVASLCMFLAPAHAQPLQAGIEQSATIGQVAPPLQAGAAFDERNLPRLHTQTGWYLVPNWYGGLWHRETQTDKVGFVPVTHTSRRDKLRGY